MLTYHNDPALKQRLLDRIAAHEAVDSIAQGAYVVVTEDGPRYCAVGCSVLDLGVTAWPEDIHAEYERLLGVPEWLGRLEDRIFEGLPFWEARDWPRRFAEAVPVGGDLDGLADRLAVRRLREEVLPLAPKWPEEMRDLTVTAIERALAVLEGEGDRASAWLAMRSAYSAYSAGPGLPVRSVHSATWAAAETMEEASVRWSARTAEAAVDAARSVVARWEAEAAWEAWSREAIRVEEELALRPVARTGSA